MGERRCCFGQFGESNHESQYQRCYFPDLAQITSFRRVRAAAAISRDAQELLTTVLVTVIHDSVTLFTCVWHLRLPNDSLAKCVTLPPEHLS